MLFLQTAVDPQGHLDLISKIVDECYREKEQRDYKKIENNKSFILFHNRLEFEINKLTFRFYHDQAKSNNSSTIEPKIPFGLKPLSQLH